MNMELNNELCINTLKNKKGSNFDIYLTSLCIENDELYLQDGNIVIYCGHDIYINIFSFESNYFKSEIPLNSIHFLKSSEPCFFNSIPLENIMRNRNMPTIKVLTRKFGVLEDLILFNSEEKNDEEKTLIPKALAFIFTKKVICFMSDSNNTNQTNYFTFSKEKLDSFVKDNNLLR